MNEDRIQVYSTPCNAREPLHIKRSDIEQVVLEVMQRVAADAQRIAGSSHGTHAMYLLQASAARVHDANEKGEPLDTEVSDPLREAVRELLSIAGVLGSWFEADEDVAGRVTLADGGVCYSNRRLREALAKVKVLLES